MIMMYNCSTWRLTLTKTKVPFFSHEFCKKSQNNAEFTQLEKSAPQLANWRVSKILSMSFQWSRHFQIPISMMKTFPSCRSLLVGQFRVLTYLIWSSGRLHRESKFETKSKSKDNLAANTTSLERLNKYKDKYLFLQETWKEESLNPEFGGESYSFLKVHCAEGSWKLRWIRRRSRIETC